MCSKWFVTIDLVTCTRYMMFTMHFNPSKELHPLSCLSLWNFKLACAEDLRGVPTRSCTTLYPQSLQFCCQHYIDVLSLILTKKSHTLCISCLRWSYSSIVLIRNTWGDTYKTFSNHDCKDSQVWTNKSIACPSLLLHEWV